MIKTTSAAEGRALRLYRDIETRLMADARPSEALNDLMVSGKFEAYPFELLKKLEQTAQSPVYHPEGNVWLHTLLVVDEAARRRTLSANPRAFMWAALLHDIGKPQTTRTRGGRITAYDHDKVGADITRDFLQYVGEDESFIAKVVYLVRYHMQVLYVTGNMPFQDIAGMKRDGDVREVALLGLCDRLGRRGAQLPEEEEAIRLFLKRCDQFEERKTNMAKAGMRRPDPREPHGTESNRISHFPKNQAPPVAELQGRAKFTKEKANPILYETPEGTRLSSGALSKEDRPREEGRVSQIKESAYFNLDHIGGTHGIKELKHSLDALGGVLSVSVSEKTNCVAVDFDASGESREHIKKTLERMGYTVTDARPNGTIL